MFRCVSIAPLGVPVVPPVYWSTARSSGRMCTRGGERGRERVGAYLQVEECELCAEKLRGWTIGPLDRRDRQEIRERAAGIRQMRSNPVVVVSEPWPRQVRRVIAHAMVRPPSTTIV